MRVAATPLVPMGGARAAVVVATVVVVGLALGPREALCFPAQRGAHGVARVPGRLEHAGQVRALDGTYATLPEVIQVTPTPELPFLVKPRTPSHRVEKRGSSGVEDGAAASQELLAKFSRAEDWQSIFSALKLFHETYGDLCIDDGWRVPCEDPWPRRLHGAPLARLVYRMKFWQKHIASFPSRREQLDHLGFIWSRLQSEYNVVLEALVTFRHLRGDLRVPATFVVPCQAPWPESCWKMRLGQRVSLIRNRGDYISSNPERWFQLDDLGFVWEASEDSWDRFHAALVAYKEVHGHLFVPRSFKVPSTSEWPVQLHGYKLGVTVSNVRSKHTLIANEPERAVSLEELGFVWDVSAARFNQMCEALLIFKSVHGAVNVPRNFTVPEEAPWPRRSWGLSLGSMLSRVRNRGDLVKDLPQRKAMLESLGFSPEPTHRTRAKARHVPTSDKMQKGKMQAAAAP